uniref:DM10 domain-containing protein n=2 Tax=Graphocephala atropunctata TaxID=36148 RepID=A0A1B6KTD4_9HEMI
MEKERCKSVILTRDRYNTLLRLKNELLKWADISKVEKLSFLAEWYDIEASVIRQFYFSFFPSDCTVEMFDIKNHKLFLKRTHCGGLSLKDIFVGNTIKIFSRQIKIVDYADGLTKKKLEVSMQRSFCLIKPDGIVNKGEIICCILTSGFQISRLKMTRLSKEEAMFMYNEHQGKSFFPYLLDHVTSGPVIGMDILSEDAVQRMTALVGPPDVSVAKVKYAGSIRATFGQDITRNAFHAAKTPEKAEKESIFFFEPRFEGMASLKPLVQLSNSTCCIIKPHAVQEGLVGKIICMIEKNNFVVSGLQLFYLDEVNAEEFLEVYKGVVPDYMSMVKQLSSGPCVAMEVTSSQSNCNVPVEFRKFAGPADPEIAKRIRPNTIRAHYGKSKIENAIHVTDLPEDASLEVEYFFKILAS